jgi:undecaprenyl-diphosphatase
MTVADTTLERFAQSLAEAALPAFFVALAALLVAVTFVGRWSLPHLHNAESETVASLRRLLVRLAVGFAVIVVAAAVFAAIAAAIGDGRTLGRLDTLISRSVGQSTSPATLQAFALITHLGDPQTLAALCVVMAIVLLVRRERLFAIGWIVAIAGNAVLNLTLKAEFARVRPLRDQAIAQADGYSFPSGHSSGSVVAYGLLAYVVIHMTPRAFHLPALLAGATIAFATGCSRIFLQVHYPSDVIAGFASGLAWLTIVVASIEATRHYRRR